MLFLAIIVSVLLGYLIGSILFAYICGLVFFKINITKMGSNNPGSTNLRRCTKGLKFSFPIYIFATSLDITKTYIPALISAILYHYLFLNKYDMCNEFNSWIIFLSCLFAAIGHCYPVHFLIHLFYHRDQRNSYIGGKGVATAGATYFVYSPIAAVILLSFHILLKKVFKLTSVSSIIALIIAPFFVLILLPWRGYMIWNTVIGAAGASTYINDTSWELNSYYWIVFAIFCCISLLSIFRHKANIIRLFHKSELK